MSSEFIGFRGRGFWSKGAEVLAHFIARHLYEHVPPEPWARAVGETLANFAYDVGGNGIGFDLDDDLPDDASVESFLAVLDAVGAELAKRGSVPADELNRARLGSGEESFVGDWEVARSLDQLAALRSLLRGECAWTAADAPTL